MKTIFTPRLIQMLFWGLYIPLGLWACQQVGISWDEGIELHTYKVNLEALLGIAQGDLTPYQALLTYGDRYYGVGFHILANLLSFLIEIVSPISADLGSEARRITLNHIAIFLSWVGSGYLVGQILKRITQDDWTATLGMIACLLWPYLLGHGLMNIKDIPFMFAWLLCTNQLLKIVGDPKQASSMSAYILLGIFTGWLISIRISGVLIAIEYLTFAALFWNTLIGAPKASRSNLETFPPQKRFPWKNLALFLVASSVMLYICYPILWHNPLELFNAISYMSHHPWDGDTLTAGRFIAGNQLHWYLLAWLFVKLPLIALLGLALIPLAFFKLASQNTQIASTQISQARWSARALLALLMSVLFILVALLIQNVSLYNELRQILLIFPLLWIIAITSLCFIGRKMTIALLLASISVFTWDNVRLFPYNYVYFNEIARQFPIATQYEKDYFGLSAKQSAQWLNHSDLTPMTNCIYASPLHLWQYAIDPKKVSCVNDFSQRPSNPQAQKYFIAIPVRDKVKQLPIPTCKLLHSEERTLPLSSQVLVMGELYSCQP
jgi:hypothetical protein